MKKYNINPHKIADLVNLAANLYTFANDEVGYSPQRGEKATQMHFVADLLKNLVEMAYPIEEKNEEDLPRDTCDVIAYGIDGTTKKELNKAIKKAIPESIVEEYRKYKENMKNAGSGDYALSYTAFLKTKQQFKELDKQMENIYKIMQDYKPPKAGDTK